MTNEHIENISQSINEPTQVIPGFAITTFQKPVVDGSGRTAEYDAWQKDLEERRRKGEQFAEKRRQQQQNAKKDVDVVAELDNALSALEAGAQEFEQTHLKPNLPLIEARNEVERLRSELATAEALAHEIESRGDSVTRLQSAVLFAEGSLNGLISTAEQQIMRELVSARFGWEIPMQKVNRERIRELALDVRIQSLREFAIQQHRNASTDVAALQKRMEEVGTKLAELRDHLATA